MSAAKYAHLCDRELVGYQEQPGAGFRLTLQHQVRNGQWAYWSPRFGLQTEHREAVAS